MKLRKSVLKCFVLCTFLFFPVLPNEKNKSFDSYSGIPDILNSISFNNALHLNAVANCNPDTDYSTITDTIISMYNKNSFHTIKFSTDMHTPSYIEIDVFADIFDFQGNKKLFTIEYFPFSGEKKRILEYT